MRGRPRKGPAQNGANSPLNLFVTVAIFSHATVPTRGESCLCPGMVLHLLLGWHCQRSHKKKSRQGAHHPIWPWRQLNIAPVKLQKMRPRNRDGRYNLPTYVPWSGKDKIEPANETPIRAPNKIDDGLASRRWKRRKGNGRRTRLPTNDSLLGLAATWHTHRHPASRILCDVPRHLPKRRGQEKAPARWSSSTDSNIQQSYFLPNAGKNRPLICCGRMGLQQLHSLSSRPNSWTE